MEKIYTSLYQILANTKTSFKRYLYYKIDWQERLIAIVGARGSGKTTLLLQHIKETYGSAPTKALYVSLDHIWFTQNTIYDLAEKFVLMGGEALYLDEVHKYNHWASEIKNIYDSFPSLKIVITGSSIIKLYQGESDLSRRMIKYDLYDMSFREYINYTGALHGQAYTLDEIVANHISIAQDIASQIKVLPLFADYMQFGNYPYFKKNKKFYHERLIRTVDTVLETDLPCIERIDYYAITKIRRLLYIISTMVPFTPNISELSDKIGVSRSTLITYLHFLQKAQIIQTIEKDAISMKRLVKPDKIYLHNTNLCHAYAETKPNEGTLRETFACNQLAVGHLLSYSKESDFLVDGRLTFEVGGKNKKNTQIAQVENSYRLLDNIEIGFGNAIPLWLIGWMY